MNRIKLRDIYVFHGENVVENDVYIEHFKKQGKDVEHFLTEIIGRKTRYMVDPKKENCFSIAMKAVNGVLKKSGFTGEDFDMIIYSSVLPEYVLPPSSIHVHHAIGGKKDCICYDFNTACAGMTISLDMISKYVNMTESVNRVLVVGCDYVSVFMNPESEYCYGHYGDASCAVILEKTDEDCGVLGSKCSVNSSEHNNIVFPGCGVSGVKKTIRNNGWLLNWTPFENVSIPTAVENMNKLLTDNGLAIDDISMFCFSQYALCNIKDLRKLMNIDENKSLFIGSEYGYTGTSSPFIALYEAIERKLIKRGDYVMFWTIGAGSQNISLLFKY